MSDPCGYNPDDPTPQPEKSPCGPGSPLAPYYHPPRLGIIHLLAWTAATAVLLKFSIAVKMIGPTDAYSLTPAWNVFQQATYFVYNTAHAAGLVGTGILLLARLPGRLQPGHWLVLITTVRTLLDLSYRMLCALADSWAADLSSRQWSLAMDGLMGMYGLMSILCAGLYFGAGLMCKDDRKWKICFATLGTIGLMRGLSDVAARFFGLFGTLRFFSLSSWIVGPALLLTVLVDLRRGPRRDWLHWVGVAIVATGAVMPAVERLWRLFAGPIQVSF